VFRIHKSTFQISQRLWDPHPTPPPKNTACLSFCLYFHARIGFGFKELQGNSLLFVRQSVCLGSCEIPKQIQVFPKDRHFFFIAEAVCFVPSLHKTSTLQHLLRKKIALQSKKSKSNVAGDYGTTPDGGSKIVETSRKSVFWKGRRGVEMQSSFEFQGFCFRQPGVGVSHSLWKL